MGAFLSEYSGICNFNYKERRRGGDSNDKPDITARSVIGK